LNLLRKVLQDDFRETFYLLQGMPDPPPQTHTLTDTFTEDILKQNSHNSEVKPTVILGGKRILATPYVSPFGDRNPFPGF
jgi:hypothetical protein